VASPGEFSVRGDIMDIYELNEEYPIRIEFFGSEVERMRFFEPTTQKSFDEAVESVMVLLVQDTIIAPYILQEKVEEIEKKVKKAEKSIKNEDVKKRLSVFFNDFIEKAKLGELPQNPKMYTSLFYPQMTTIMDYVSKDTLIVMDEYGRTLESERTQNMEAA